MFKMFKSASAELKEIGLGKAAEQNNAAIDSVDESMPAWALNIGPAKKLKDSGTSQSWEAVGDAIVENNNAEYAENVAEEEAKGKIRSILPTGIKIDFIIDDTHYEPDGVEPDRVYVRVLAKSRNSDQGSQK